MDTKYLTVQDVAILLNTSKKNVHRLLAEGEIRCTRYHHRVIITLEDFARYLACRSTGIEQRAPPWHSG